MTSDIELLRAAADHAIAYAATIDDRHATPTSEAIAGLVSLDGPLPDHPTDARETIDLLARVGGPATIGSTGAKYFGFVNGATYPVALGASMIVNAWDQNAALPVMSPVAAKIYDITRCWLNDLLGLPEYTDVAFVTGATVANAGCLAAARDALLVQHGWDVQNNGLFGAPQITVIIGEQAHSTLRKSLGLVGLGRQRVTIIPADDQGRLRSDQLPDPKSIEGPVLLCAQAGEVNTGAFDPFEPLADWVADHGSAWLHVDGAFGLWALADPTRAELVHGLTRADSLATDAHKWLNVTYDCGIIFVTRPSVLRRTFAAVAGYLPPDDGFEAIHHTPQSSQRARQIEVWSVLRTLGRTGIAELVRGASNCAVAIADELQSSGFEILNDVVLNQVLVRYRDAETTERLIAEIQRDGRIWCGPTEWDGGTAMRISVSSWKTDLDEAGNTADVITACAAAITPPPGLGPNRAKE